MKYAQIITKLAAKFEAKLANDRFTDESRPGTGSRGLTDEEIDKLREDLAKAPESKNNHAKNEAVRAVARYWNLDSVGERERDLIEAALNLGSQLGKDLP